jgi:hypothetical protein
MLLNPYFGVVLKISGVPRGVWGYKPPSEIPKFYKAELNSHFRGKYIRDKLIRIRVSLI